MSNNEGKKFEEDFSNSILKDNIFIYRLKDTSSGWSSGQVSRFTVKNSCDFISFNPIKRNIVLFECKSFLGKSCPFSNIKPHQVSEMFYYSLNNDVEAYFILNFRALEETYAVKVEDIKELIESNTTKSISLKFCIENGVLLEQNKKKTRFYYNINSLFKENVDIVS